MNHRNETQLISIIVPVYCEERNLSRLVARLDNVLEKESTKYSFEYIFVNDGSKDGSFDTLRLLSEQNKKVRALDFSRNFGKEIALSAGVDASRGSAVVCIDADLQHPPELIVEMLRAWENGAEVVATIRRSTDKKAFARKVGSHVFYWLMSRFSDVDIVSQATDFRLLDRKVVEAYITIQERKRLFRGLIDWLGFRKVWLEFRADARVEGRPSYSYSKLWDLALNSFVSYSSKPLLMVGYLGVFITVSSAALLCWMVGTKYFAPHYNITPLAMFVVFNTWLVGLVLTALGLVSLYLNKIYGEILDRPLYVVRDVVGFTTPKTRSLTSPSDQQFSPNHDVAPFLDRFNQVNNDREGCKKIL